MNDESFDRPRRKAVALDPHPLCHTALATLLARFDIDLVGAATSTRTAETLLQEHQPDLLVMEIDLAEGHEAALRDDLERAQPMSEADGDRPLGDEPIAVSSTQRSTAARLRTC